MNTHVCRLAVLLVAVCVSADAKPPPKQQPSRIEQSGGVHTGDNVIGNQRKVIIQGPATIVEGDLVMQSPPRSIAAPEKKPAVKPVPKNKQPPRSELVAKFITDGCRLRPAMLTSQMFAELWFDFGMSIADHVSIPADEPPAYRKFTGARRISTPRALLEVSPEEFDREAGCVEFVREDCIEYDIYSIEDGRQLQRRWTREWEDQESKGLLGNPDRLTQIVHCFSEDDVSLTGDAAQLWTIRLEGLANLLEQEQSAQQIGAARRHDLLADVLQRWAHLVILRPTREPASQAHHEAAEIFARAAQLRPTDHWLRKAAADEFVKAGEFDRAADEQEKVLALLNNDAVDGTGADVERHVLASFALIQWRGAASQFERAEQALTELRKRLDSSSSYRMSASDRRKYQALAHMLTGETFGSQGKWDLGSSYYEAAADLAAGGNWTSFGNDAAADLDSRLEPQRWLMHAGTLACFGNDRARIDALDRRIRANIPYFNGQGAQPTWSTWVYLTAYLWSTHKLRDRSAWELARREADDALEKLLLLPAVIKPTLRRPWNIYNERVEHPDNVPALNGLFFGRRLAGGVFPVSTFIDSDTSLGTAGTAQLYRSIVEQLVRAEQSNSQAQTRDAQRRYKLAIEIAGELTKRIPLSGPFLEIAVLRAEASFLQGHHLDPHRSGQLMARADALQVTATCDEAIRNVYQQAPQRLAASKQLFEKETFLGPVPLLCPYSLEGGAAGPG